MDEQVQSSCLQIVITKFIKITQHKNQINTLRRKIDIMRRKT